MRAINVNNTIYKYKIGKQNVVIVSGEFESKRKKAVPFNVLLNRDQSNIEMEIWKRSFHITPRDIQIYIRRGVAI